MRIRIVHYPTNDTAELCKRSNCTLKHYYAVYELGSDGLEHWVRDFPRLSTAEKFIEKYRPKHLANEIKGRFSHGTKA